MIRLMIFLAIVFGALLLSERCHGAARRQVRGEEIAVVWNPNPIGENVTIFEL